MGYSPGRCKQYYFPLSKMIEKLENQEFTKQEDVLTDLMKEMLRVTCLGSTVYFGKNRADVGSRSVYLRPHRKDLELISKRQALLVKWFVIL